MKEKLIILSGGMDSVTLLHYEKANIKMALSFYYGQKHSKELEFANRNCRLLNIEHHLIDISNFSSLMKSDLLKNGGEIPEGHYEDATMKSTVVPFRNGIMLAIATGIAESNGCKSILIANHAGDHAIYPDCRATFIEAMNEAMNNGTYANICIDAPFTHISKRDVALIGHHIGVDYELTWSCYKGKEIHCGKCGTCTERKEALIGFDTTKYEG